MNELVCEAGPGIASQSNCLPIIIIGAGCAGLSLTVALLKEGVDNPIIIIEKECGIGRSGTFAYFDVFDHHFSHLVNRRFNKMQIVSSANGENRVETLTPYCTIDTHDFFNWSVDFIKGFPQVQFLLGRQDLGSVTQSADHDYVCVELGDEILKASHVFDSRPVAGKEEQMPKLWQSFAGWTVQFDKPLFTPDAVTLMDFAAGEDALPGHFFYILPFDSRRALVESTLISLQEMSFAEHERLLTNYLYTLCLSSQNDSFEILEKERGCIPMALVEAKVENTPSAWRIQRIGIAGGAARASTGYAFLNIQRRSMAIAANFAGKNRDHRHTNLPLSLLDYSFLDAIAKRPGLTESLLGGIFTRSAASTVVRFLSDVPTLGDCLKICHFMPHKILLSLSFLRACGYYLAKQIKLA